MNLFIKTIKSFTKKEKLVGSVLLLVFLASFYNVFLSESAKLDLSHSKSYSEGVVGEIKHLNPVYTEFSEADKDISSLIFSGLVKYNSQSNEFDEDIATHVLSEDKLSYTFTLKNNITWHDGTEVTADDIYFTFAEVIQSPEFNNPILKSNFEGVKVSKDDSRTVTFTLTAPNSFFYSGLTVGILPKHILADVPVSELDTNDFNKMPIGTGPYQVTSPYEFNSDGSMMVNLKTYSGYYGPIPTISDIRFIAYPTVSDLVANQSIWHGAARIQQSQLAEMNLENMVTYQYELPQYTALFFNTDSPLLTKSKTRLGISKAIVKEDIISTINYKVRIDTPLLELNQNEWIHTSDTNEAMGAFFDGGWTLAEGETVRTNEDGEKLSLRLVRRDFNASNPAQEEIYQMTTDVIVKQLNSVGVEVVVEEYEAEELQDIIKNRDYDMLLYGQSLGYNLDTFSYWHSSQASELGLNLSNYQNPKADFYIESVRETFDDEEREELLISLGEIISNDVPAVFLYTPSYYYVVNKKVTGINFQKLLLPKDRFANIAQWVLN